MTLPPVARSTLGHLERLARLLPRGTELTRAVTAQSQMEALLLAVRGAIAAGDTGRLVTLSAEAERITQTFAAGCGAKPGAEALAVIGLGKAVRDLCAHAPPREEG